MERVQQVLEIRGNKWGLGPAGDAVKASQLDRGLEVDGEVGPDTWQTLFLPRSAGSMALTDLQNQGVHGPRLTGSGR